MMPAGSQASRGSSCMALVIQLSCLWQSCLCACVFVRDCARLQVHLSLMTTKRCFL